MSPKSKNKKRKYRPFDPEALERPKPENKFWREYHLKTTEAGVSYSHVAGSQEESGNCQDILRKLQIAEYKRRIMAEANVTSDGSNTSYARKEYASLDSRLVTFCDWPPSLTQKPTELAEAGFYYSGRGDEVKCYSCDVSLSFWLKDETPWQRHAISFPSCDVVLGVVGAEYVAEALSEKTIKEIQGNLLPRKSSKLIDEELENILNSDIVSTAIKVGLKEESIRDVIKGKLKQGENPFQNANNLVDIVLAQEFRKLDCDIRVTPAPLFTPPEEQQPKRPGYNLNLGEEISPFSPEYSEYIPRIKSFRCWPPSIPKTAQELAEAGFYYTEQGDKVKCFCCDARISSWQEDSDPWLEHAVTRPTCELVLLTKGQGFVNEALILKAAEDLKMDESAIKEVVQRRQERGAGPFLSAESLCAEVMAYQSGEVNPEETLPEAIVNEEIINAKDVEISELEEENQRLKEACLCKICMLEEVGSVFLPCGHIAACMNCAEKCTSCPICRKPISGKIKSYLS